MNAPQGKCSGHSTSSTVSLNRIFLINIRATVQKRFFIPSILITVFSGYLVRYADTGLFINVFILEMALQEFH